MGLHFGGAERKHPEPHSGTAARLRWWEGQEGSFAFAAYAESSNPF